MNEERPQDGAPPPPSGAGQAPPPPSREADSHAPSEPPVIPPRGEATTEWKPTPTRADDDKPESGWPETGQEMPETAAVATTEHDSSDEPDVDEAPSRKIRLAISRIDPWSTLKLSFLLSVAIGIGIVVATASVWFMLDGLGVFTKVDELIQSMAGEEGQIDILQFVEFNKVISLATIVAVVDVIVITVIATLGSIIYNITAALIGGLHVTLTDE